MSAFDKAQNQTHNVRPIYRLKDDTKITAVRTRTETGRFYAPPRAGVFGQSMTARPLNAQPQFNGAGDPWGNPMSGQEQQAQQAAWSNPQVQPGHHYQDNVYGVDAYNGQVLYLVVDQMVTLEVEGGDSVEVLLSTALEERTIVLSDYNYRGVNFKEFETIFKRVVAENPESAIVNQPALLWVGELTAFDVDHLGIMMLHDKLTDKVFTLDKHLAVQRFGSIDVIDILTQLRQAFKVDFGVVDKEITFTNAEGKACGFHMQA